MVMMRKICSQICLMKLHKSSGVVSVPILAISTRLDSAL